MNSQLKTYNFLLCLCFIFIVSGCQLPVYETLPIKSAPTPSLQPIAPSATPKIVYVHLFDGRPGLRSFTFNDWLVYRQNSGHFFTPQKPIRLESDLALEYICKQKGVNIKECTWFAVFYTGNMKIIATRRYPEAIVANLPELDKAIDNNGKLLKNSRSPYFKTLIKKSNEITPLDQNSALRKSGK